MLLQIDKNNRPQPIQHVGSQLKNSLLCDGGHTPSCSVYQTVLGCRPRSICEMCPTHSAQGGSQGKRIITEERDVAM